MEAVESTPQDVLSRSVRTSVFHTHALNGKVRQRILSIHRLSAYALRKRYITQSNDFSGKQVQVSSLLFGIGHNFPHSCGMAARL